MLPDSRRRSRSCPTPSSTRRFCVTLPRSTGARAGPCPSPNSSERRPRHDVQQHRVVLPPDVIEVVRRLAPAATRKVRAALDELSRDPRLGEPLHREVTRRWRLRVGALRIVYRPRPDGIEVVAIGPRRTIYTDMAREARRR